MTWPTVEKERGARTQLSQHHHCHWSFRASHHRVLVHGDGISGSWGHPPEKRAALRQPRRWRHRNPWLAMAVPGFSPQNETRPSPISQAISSGPSKDLCSWHLARECETRGHHQPLHACSPSYEPLAQRDKPGGDRRAHARGHGEKDRAGPVGRPKKKMCPLLWVWRPSQAKSERLRPGVRRDLTPALPVWTAALIPRLISLGFCSRGSSRPRGGFDSAGYLCIALLPPWDRVGERVMVLWLCTSARNQATLFPTTFSDPGSQGIHYLAGPVSAGCSLRGTCPSQGSGRISPRVLLEARAKNPLFRWREPTASWRAAPVGATFCELHPADARDPGPKSKKHVSRVEEFWLAARRHRLMRKRTRCEHGARLGTRSWWCCATPSRSPGAGLTTVPAKRAPDQSEWSQQIFWALPVAWNGNHLILPGTRAVPLSTPFPPRGGGRHSPRSVCRVQFEIKEEGSVPPVLWYGLWQRGPLHRPALPLSISPTPPPPHCPMVQC